MQIIRGIKMYNAEEVAEILGIHKTTVITYIKKGHLPGVKLGAYYMVTEENMMNFVQGVT